MKNIINFFYLALVFCFSFLQFSYASEKSNVSGCNHNPISVDLRLSYDFDLADKIKLNNDGGSVFHHRRCCSCELEKKDLYFCDHCNKIIFCDANSDLKINANSEFKSATILSKIQNNN